MKTLFKKRKLMLVTEIVLGSLSSIMAVATGIAMPYSNIISQFLNQDVQKIVNVEDEKIDNEYFKSEYKDTTKLLQDQRRYAEEVQAEGSVILQNKGLPIAKKGKVTLLGSGCAKGSFLIGGASGSGAITEDEAIDLKMAFEHAGYEVNPFLWSFYNSGAGKSKRGTSKNAREIGEAKISAYTDLEKNSFAQYSDAAILVFGQRGEEGKDVFQTTKEDADKTELEFSDDQLALVDLAKEHFANVVVLLNTSNPMEVAPLIEKDVSIVWVGLGGHYGMNAIPSILNGNVNPSGRLVDTYVYDSYSAPSMKNFGDFTFENVNPETLGDKYVVYQEGIYVGYRYYETRYADKVMGKGNAGDYNYKDTVTYPFGYGLSYTTFEYKNFNVLEKADSFEISLKVENTGDVVGKEIVQIFMQSPYTDYDIQNGIEKSAVELVGFSKTDDIQPHSSVDVKISVSKEKMRSYDANGSGTYIIDAGDYFITAGKNAHDSINNILSSQGYSTSDGMTENGNSDLVYRHTEKSLDKSTYAKTSVGNEIKNQFEDVDIRKYDKDFKYLTRNDWSGTFPNPYGGEGRKITANNEILSDMQAKFPKNDNVEMPKTSQEVKLTLASLMGKKYDDENWDTLLDSMTPSEMMQLVGYGGFGTVLIKSIGKPATVDKDSPSGISSTLIGGANAFGYPVEVLLASTWNEELARKMGSFIGEDSLYTGASGWYAPASNIHRTPFGGRNYEYFSEDGLLSGAMSKSIIETAREKGVRCYMKHFALNDQETNRQNICTFANEQAVREIYLKPFEIAVRDGNANCIMSSYNRIGLTWTGSHKGLLTNVLRNEWGFEGMVITDYMSNYNDAHNARAALDAGNDMYLCSRDGTWAVEGYENDASFMFALRTACHRILYVMSSSNCMNFISPTTRIVSVTPGWKFALFVIDGVVFVSFVAWSILYIISFKKKKESGNELNN